jgi:MoaA/NifB/PqqE/SkfB family radical SAM enzyme
MSPGQISKINELISINIAITYKCMLKCKMCNIWRINDPDEVSLEGWKRFIADLRSRTSREFMINFSGGEPLSKAGILDLVSFCAQQNFKTYIGSNAYLIDEPMAQRIVNSGLSVIGLSLDSLDENIHDSLRGSGGVYRRLMQAIDNLSRFSGNHLRIVIATIIMGENLESIIQLARWVDSDDRLSGITFQVIMQPFNDPFDGDWQKKEKYSSLWPQDPQRAQAVIDELIRLKAAGNHKILNSLSQLRSFRDYYANPNKFSNTGRCKIAGNAVDIEARGTVKLCFNLEAVGNIQENNLEDILNSPKTTQAVEAMTNCTKICHYLINCFYNADRAEKEALNGKGCAKK